jgi:protein CpxP
MLTLKLFTQGDLIMKLAQLVSSVMVCSSLLVMAPSIAAEPVSQSGSAKATIQDAAKKQHRQSRGTYPRLHGIELTEQQQQELQALRQTFRQQRTEGSRQGHAEHKQAMQALLQADYFDETQARLLLEQQQQSKLERHLAALQWRHAVYQLLTEEQQQQWQQQRRSRQGSAERPSRWQRKGNSTL